MFLIISHPQFTIPFIYKSDFIHNYYSNNYQLSNSSLKIFQRILNVKIIV